MAVAALIFGICALCFCWFGGYAGIFFGIPGIIFSCLNRSGKRGMSVTGRVLSIVGLAVGVSIFVICSMTDSYDVFYEAMEEFVEIFD